jgi:hypothetical protein
MRAHWILLTFVLCGCESALAPMASTVCYERAVVSAGGESREPEDADWIGLLTTRDEGQLSGCELALEELPTRPPPCSAVPEGRRLTPIRPEVVAYEARPGELEAVWVATHGIQGTSWVRGPLALVARTPLGLEVQAVGVHEGSRNRAALRVLRPSGGTVVVVESEEGSRRIADLLVQAGGTLNRAEPPGEERCASPAHVLLLDQSEARENTWLMRTVLSTQISDEEGALWIREHRSVRELDPDHPENRPRSTEDHDRNQRWSIAQGRLRLEETTDGTRR